MNLLKKLINDENIRNKMLDKKINKSDYKIIMDLTIILYHLTVRSSQNIAIEILPDYIMFIMHSFTCLSKIGFQK